MSVIYRALKTIEAAEGAQSVSPSISTYAGNGSQTGPKGGIKRPDFGLVLGGVGGAVIVLLGIITLLSNFSNRAVRPDPDTVERTAIESSAAQQFALELKRRHARAAAVVPKQADKQGEVVQESPAKDAAESVAENAVHKAAATSEKKAVLETPQARVTTVSQPAATVNTDSRRVQKRAARDVVTVTADHTQRVRILNARLGQAVRARNAGKVDRILVEMKSLVGGDSAYMLKVQAFAQLALGRDIDGASALLQEVLARDPGDRDAALNMAVAEIRLGQRAQARGRLEALAIDHPGDRQIDELLKSIH